MREEQRIRLSGVTLISAVQGPWRDCRESVQDAYGPMTREAMDGMMFNGETADKRQPAKKPPVIEPA